LTRNPLTSKLKARITNTNATDAGFEAGMTNYRGVTMDNDLFEKGLAKRKDTLGAEYVEKNLAAADEFTRPFQEAMTAWCWGFGWGDEVIEPKTRSMMNLAMIGALGKMHEWEIHCRGAISNGVSKEEIRAIIHVVGIYCGVPQSLECFRVARKVLEEDGQL
jgi:4-carboxymuconolactone decarboxylase